MSLKANASADYVTRLTLESAKTAPWLQGECEERAGLAAERQRARWGDPRETKTKQPPAGLSGRRAYDAMRTAE